MEPEVQSKGIKSKKKSIILIALAAFLLLTLSTTTAFAYMTLSSDKVYKGIYVGSQDVSGLSRQELKQVLDTKFQSAIDVLDITLKADKSELIARYPELNIRYDTETAAQNAYAIGHSGNIFERLFDIAQASIKGAVLEIPFSFDEDKLDSFVNRFYDMTFINVNEGALLITDNNVTMRSGHHGENIDKLKTTQLVKALIEDRKGGIVEPEVIITPPTKFNVDELYKQIVCEPVDASYKMENSVLTLSPHSVGRQIDSSRLQEIVAELDQSENTERILPVNFNIPEITSEVATSLLFKDDLASYSTQFSTATQNGKNRGYNMGLAVDKINNMILAPGQEFSFNVVVGPRSLEYGFKLAHVYSAGKIIDGVGGGICQVSSTMYNAVLKADLQVTERRNHSFIVGYVPLGQDATAYYGGTDFRFMNSGKWPIKLLATVSGNKISFSIKGTNDSPGKSVIISNKVLKETPFTVKYTDDPTLPVGTTKQLQEGLKGFVAETYKTIKIDGNVVSQDKLHTSTYKPCPQLLLRGTKPLVTTTTTSSGAIVPASGTVNPVAPGEAIDQADTEKPDGSSLQSETNPALD